MRRKLLFAAALLLLVLVTASCSLMQTDNLYTPPKVSAEYEQLQDVIESILGSGAEYSAPAAGANRQTVQLEDIDSDGIREAIAFFNFNGDDMPLKIYIFKNQGGTYEQAAVIEGEGTNIHSIAYADMDGDGVSEVIVGWQVNAELKMLSIYRIRDYQITQLSATNYNRYTTLNMDDKVGAELVVLRTSGTDDPGEAEMFSLSENGELISSKASITEGVVSITRVRTGTISNGRSAVYVESLMDGSSIVTDVFVCRNGMLNNVLLSSSAGGQNRTVRTYSIYSQDINNDGMLEIPEPALVENSDGSTYWKVTWCVYSSVGRKTEVVKTYHNTSDGWFYVLPAEWGDNIELRRVDTVPGERTILFSYYDAQTGEIHDFLKIYTFSGSNRFDRADIGDRFILLETTDTIFAAEILSDISSYGVIIDEERIAAGFSIIYSEWETGELA